MLVCLVCLRVKYSGGNASFPLWSIEQRLLYITVSLIFFSLLQEAVTLIQGELSTARLEVAQSTTAQQQLQDEMKASVKDADDRSQRELQRLRQHLVQVNGDQLLIFTVILKFVSPGGYLFFTRPNFSFYCNAVEGMGLEKSGRIGTFCNQRLQFLAKKNGPVTLLHLKIKVQGRLCYQA